MLFYTLCIIFGFQTALAYSGVHELHNVYSSVYEKDHFLVRNLCPKLQSINYSGSEKFDLNLVEDFDLTESFPDCTFKTQNMNNTQSYYKVRLIAAFITKDVKLNKSHKTCRRRYKFNLDLDKTNVIIIPKGICKIPYKFLNWVPSLESQKQQPVLWQFSSGSLGITFPDNFNQLQYFTSKPPTFGRVHLVFKIFNGTEFQFRVEYYKLISANETCMIPSTEGGCEIYDSSVQNDLYKKIYKIHQLQGDFVPNEVFNQMVTVNENDGGEEIDKQGMNLTITITLGIYFIFTVLPVTGVICFSWYIVHRERNRKKKRRPINREEPAIPLRRLNSSYRRNGSRVISRDSSTSTDAVTVGISQQSDDNASGISSSVFCRPSAPIPEDISTPADNEDLPPSYESALNPPTYDESIHHV